MRNYVMALLTSGCMLSGSVFAIGFCDNTQIDAPIGSGNCRQARTTTAAHGSVYPSFSDLDMSEYWDHADQPISFTLDIGRLYVGGSPQDEQRVEVLELTAAQFSLINSPGGGVSGEHVLTITVDRHPNGTWSLGYAWLLTPGGWSIVRATSMPSIEAGEETTDFGPLVSRVVVDITPLSGWNQFVVSARPDGMTVGGLQTPSIFNMPIAGPNARNLPLKLRTGVLGGDLTAAGMQTQYVFTAPYINNQQ